MWAQQLARNHPEIFSKDFGCGMISCSCWVSFLFQGLPTDTHPEIFRLDFWGPNYFRLLSLFGSLFPPKAPTVTSSNSWEGGRGGSCRLRGWGANSAEGLSKKLGAPHPPTTSRKKNPPRGPTIPQQFHFRGMELLRKCGIWASWLSGFFFLPFSLREPPKRPQPQIQNSREFMNLWFLGGLLGREALVGKRG